MDGRKILSGSQLVAKGATKKVDGLPEVGLKDVASNGSWLEQKQIQSALEARKHLIAVERIEKSGSLSHAEWRDDLKLAEVTKQTGSHWQFMGHKQGKYLYLLPEETLFLIETNSLLLKHNDVTVSLQKAYSLCLSEMSITQYKVYASLSRLGYKVFRHKEPTSDKRNGQKQNEDKTTAEKHAEINAKKLDADANNIINNADDSSTSKTTENETPLGNISVNIEDLTEAVDDTEKENDNVILHNTNSIVDNKTSQHNEEKSLPTLDVTDNVNEGNNDISVTTSSMEVDDNANETIPTNVNVTVISSQENETNSTESSQMTNDKIADVYSIDEFGVIRVFEKNVPMETDDVDSIVERTDINVTDCNSPTTDSSNNDSFNNYQLDLKYYDDKIKTLTERKSENQNNNQGLDTIQDFYNQQIVKVNVPDETYLPRNIFLHKTEYTLNMETIRNQNASNANDERESATSTPASSTASLRPSEIPRYQSLNSNTQDRQSGYPAYFLQRPPQYNEHLNFNNCMFRMPNFYGPRYHSNSFVRQQFMVFNVNTTNNFPDQDRRDSLKSWHYDMIVHITMRLKHGLATPAQIRALRSLLNTYNARYNTNIRLMPDFNIVNTLDTVPVQKVIDVDDESTIPIDDEPERKKPRLNDDNMKYKINLEKLKQLAVKLKELQLKKLAVSRHRRVFSNAIKTFNKSFNADIYLDSNFDIADRKTVVVDTSSDSDAVVVKVMPKRRKKLRNPYSILMRIAKDVNVGASTSLEVPVLRTLTLNVINKNTSKNTTKDNANRAPNVVNANDENLLKQFYKSRFSGNDDFGGAKLCSRINAQLDAIIFQAEHMNDILKTSLEYRSWIEIKLAFLKGIRRSLNLQKQQVEALSSDLFTTESRIQPILGPDCTDLKSALKKLAIIPTNKEIPAETSLTIHFDVCNRHVHFKKSNPPKPNFRVICYDELALFPSPEDVVALHAKYPDGVPTVFAFVGISASISYLQINPIDLPVFIPDKDLA